MNKRTRKIYSSSSSPSSPQSYDENNNKNKKNRQTILLVVTGNLIKTFQSYGWFKREKCLAIC